ncbi:MAG: hypothetical protein Q8P99_02895 [bacterium]|nr:hypothetical protein [bacterium]
MTDQNLCSHTIVDGPSLLDMIISLSAKSDKRGHRPTVMFTLDGGTVEEETEVVIDGLHRVPGNRTGWNIEGAVVSGMMELLKPSFIASFSTSGREGSFHHVTSC